MASILSPTIAYHFTSNTRYNSVYPVIRGSILSLSSHFISFSSSINHSFSSPIHLHRSFPGSPLNPNRSILRSSLVPPPGKEPQRSTGIAATLSKIWDTVQIFFAVFFWMSLFFWASASDGNNSGSRNRRDRFRK